MEFDKLRYTLNKIEKTEKNKEVRYELHELNWEIGKNGISGLSSYRKEELDGAVGFDELLLRIANIAVKSKENSVRANLKKLASSLCTQGIDGLIPGKEYEKVIRKVAADFRTIKSERCKNNGLSH